MSNGSEARATDDNGDGEFSVSAQQLASAQDPHCTFRSLIEQLPDPQPPRRVGRPYHIWRHDLELARSLNERLSSGAPD